MRWGDIFRVGNKPQAFKAQLVPTLMKYNLSVVNMGFGPRLKDKKIIKKESK